PVQMATPSNMPTRRPTRSSTDPHMGLPRVYARKKNDAASVKFWLVSPVSRMIVGARIVRTWRSTKESQEQRAIPRQGTHCCQARLGEAVVVGETLAMGPPRIRLMWH